MKPATRKNPVYFAHSTEAMRNGSYFRSDGKTFALYLNGDYMGEKPAEEWPLLPLRDYVQFDKADAKQLIPKCCR